jgi:ferredoxin
MKVVADLDVCIGAGVCVLTAPKVFDQSPDDGRVRVLVEEVPADEARLIREAVDLCPSGALSICEDEDMNVNCHHSGRQSRPLLCVLEERHD